MSSTEAPIKPREEKSPRITLRVLVEAKDAGSIIGKKGAVISKFREECGAHVDVAEAVRGATRRVVTVRGTLEQAIQTAEWLAERISEKDRERRRTTPEGEPELSITLLVNNAQVGCLIGKGGETIKKTREDSGCHVRVSQKTLDESSEKTVAIQGDQESLRKAINIIVSQLAETQDRAIPTKPFVPRALEAAFAHPAHVAYDPYTLASLMRAQPQVAQGALQSLLPQPTGFPTPLLPTAPPPPPVSPPRPAAPAIPGEQTMVIPVREDQVGAVLGRGGATIKDIRLRSRAQVVVAEKPVAGSTERLVTITGSRQSCDVAVALVCEKIMAPPRRGGGPRRGRRERGDLNATPAPAPATPARRDDSGATSTAPAESPDNLREEGSRSQQGSPLVTGVASPGGAGVSVGVSSMAPGASPLALDPDSSYVRHPGAGSAVVGGPLRDAAPGRRL